MRLFTASLLVAGSVLAHTHNSQPKLRKSLSFGPVLPQSRFYSTPSQVPTSLLPPNPDACPYSVAKSVLDELTGKGSYIIRKDSYTDSNTGVTHIYARQLVNGLEVWDGDVNLNIKDGVVLSFGDSMYTGPHPEPYTSPAEKLVHPHVAHCGDLKEAIVEHQEFFTGGAGQVTLGEHHSTPEHIEHLYNTHCEHLDVPYAFHSDGTEANVHNALLQFMIAATPKPSLAQDIKDRYHYYLSKLESGVWTISHLHGRPETMEEIILNVPDTVGAVKAKLGYVQVPHNGETHLDLVWKFEVEMQDNWYEAHVSALGPHRIVSVVDWASDSPMPIPDLKKKKGKKGGDEDEDDGESKAATYNVFKWGINDPSEGNRSIEKENYDSLASPVGWHSLPYANDPLSSVRDQETKKGWRNTTTTFGNNVIAHEDWEGQNSWLHNYRPDAGEDMEFDFKYSPKTTNSSDALDEAKKYINATITQLFYTSNMVHDLFYRYGFDEVAGNFQQHNFGRGGAENDAVITNAQDGSGFNNANFMTPPDGQNGKCRMYLWNTAIPYRDGDLEAGIVIHELAHGLSTRLTGGPANSGCLGWGESGGMGEGWGDWLATTIRSNENYSDYAMGAWAANRVQGIRNFVYSLNETINPSTYKTLDKPGYWGVHAIGEVWAEILWVVGQNLIKKHGYSTTLFPPKPLENGTIPEGDFYRPKEVDELTGKPKPLVPIHGNTLMVQLVLNGMKLQTCRPSFFDARDAIIQADQVLTGGENYCELWEGFALRGLGPDARVDGRTPWGGGVRTNDHKVPLTCKKYEDPEPKFEELADDWVHITI